MNEDQLRILENRKAWLQALRSGDYNQGTGYLCRLGSDGQRSYCCLGVAAVVGGADEEHEPGLSCVHFKVNGYEVDSYLVENRGDGVPPADPYVGLTYETQVKLAELNDTDDYTFPQIADWLVANVQDEIGWE